MTQEQKDLALAKIQKHVRGCAVCGSVNFALSDQIFELREFNLIVTAEAPPVYPVVVLSCQNCTNTLFFSAVLMGLVPAI